MPEFTAAPVLETTRLILRGHRLSDFEDSAAMWADLSVVRHISGRPSSREASWSRLLRHSGHWNLLGFGYWVVQAKEDLRFLGEVGFAHYHRDITPSLEGRPEAGWVLKTSEQDQGFATEAVSRMVAWADSFIESDSTVCIFDPDHEASIRIARKMGYAEAGRARYLNQPTLVMSRPRGTDPGNP